MDISNTVELEEDIQIDSETFSWTKPLIKALLLMMVLTAGLLIITFTPLRHYLTNYREIALHLSRFGTAAPILFMAGVAALVFIGVPRLLLCFIGGMTFGFFWGLLWTQLGTMLGFYAAFLFVHWGGRDLVLRIWPKLDRLSHRFKEYGIPAVIVIRQLPFNGMFINLLLGLLPISHLNYLLGTMVGLLPEAIPCTLIGSGAIQQSFGKSFGFITAAIVLLVAVWLSCGLYVRTRRNKLLLSDSGNASAEERVERGNSTA